MMFDVIKAATEPASQPGPRSPPGICMVQQIKPFVQLPVLCAADCQFN
jgi:hypothetical protein